MSVLSNALISRDELPEITGLSPSTIDEEIRLGRFPKPRQVSARRVAWLARDLDEWMENLPQSAILPPGNTGAKKPRARGGEPAPRA